MTETLPVINRTVEIEEEVVQAGFPVWGIVIIILLSVLILLFIVMIITVLLRGKNKNNSTSELVAPKNNKGRAKVAVQKNDNLEYQSSHSSHTRHLWSKNSAEEYELIYLFARDINEPEKVYKIAVENGVMIGRTQGDIILSDDDYISSKHCVITYENGIMFVEDMGSSNGTFYHNKLIKGKTPVIDGEVIKVGNTQLKLNIKKA